MQSITLLFSEIGFCIASCSYIHIYVSKYIYVCFHVLVLHWANLVLVPSGMVHINH